LIKYMSSGPVVAMVSICRRDFPPLTWIRFGQASQWSRLVVSCWVLQTHWTQLQVPSAVTFVLKVSSQTQNRVWLFYSRSQHLSRFGQCWICWTRDCIVVQGRCYQLRAYIAEADLRVDFSSWEHWLKSMQYIQWDYYLIVFVHHVSLGLLHGLVQFIFAKHANRLSITDQIFYAELVATSWNWTWSTIMLPVEPLRNHFTRKSMITHGATWNTIRNSGRNKSIPHYWFQQSSLGQRTNQGHLLAGNNHVSIFVDIVSWCFIALFYKKWVDMSQLMPYC
jgi:hypothetical protein